ncbi:MAG TPA: cyclase family protein [Blastocatellia bacterium]|nr:cyclase family protein [Blastocatellia bacterium]
MTHSILIDLSHTIADGTVTYPGLPAPRISDYLSREDSRTHYTSGTEFQIGKLDMVGNTGTYLDSPFHRYGDGKDLSQLPLSRLANLDGVLVRATSRQGRAITEASFQELEARGIDLGGKAVMVQTGWSSHWGTEAYFEQNPFLTGGAAAFLCEKGAVLVGIDSLNIDDTGDGTRPVHSILLKHGITVLEHLTGLESLPDSGFKLFAVPPKVAGFGTFPVRAFALVEQ